MAVNFYLDNRPNKKGDCPIRVSIAIAGDRLITSTGHSINPGKWDEDTQRVKNRVTNAKGETHKMINSKLQEIKSHFDTIEAQIDAQLINPDSIKIRDVFAKEFRPNTNTQKQTAKEKSIFDYLNEFIKDEGKDKGWTNAVYEKFSALENHLRQFNPDLTFEYLDRKGLNKLVDYYHSVQVGGVKTDDVDTRVFGMKNSTIKKQLSFLKWFLKWATRNKYNTTMDFADFSPKLVTPKNKVVFLNWDELMTVYNFDIPESKKYLSRVRDVFCFTCFTSLRYSDVANLKRTDIKANHIEVVTIKTNDTLIIDLNDYSREILNKYKDESFPKDLALPVITNQRMNEYLKELGELCGIDEPQTVTYFKGNERFDEVFPKYALMSTHTGRRTFISNALIMGITPQTVMKWTGHSNYQAMQPYIDVADKERKKAMQMFNR